MKKITLIALLGIIFFSCQKVKPRQPLPPNTVVATIDGVKETFNVNVVDTLINVPASENNPAYQEFGIIAWNGQGPNADEITVEIGNVADNIITAKTYRERTYNAGSTFWPVGLNNYYTNGHNILSDFPFTVTITSITSTSVKGIFSGNIYLQGDSTLNKKVLTDGEFNIHR